MANSDWETDDEAETNYMERSGNGHISQDPSETAYADDEQSIHSDRRQLPLSHRRHKIKDNVRGTSSLKRSTKSHYEVERNGSKKIQTKYPEGPEVLTRLKHSGYPEQTEKRFRHIVDSDSDDEVRVQRAFIGMPTSSYASTLESESSEFSDSGIQGVQSTEQFVSAMQTNGHTSTKRGSKKCAETSPEALVLSGQENVKVETEDDEGSQEWESDASNYVKPSQIAHHERVLKGSTTQQPMVELQEPLERSGEEYSHPSEIDSLQDENADTWSVTSEMTASSVPTPSYQASYLPESSIAEDDSTMETYEYENQIPETEPDDTFSVEGLPIRESDPPYSESGDDQSIYDHSLKSESKSHFDTMRHFLSIKGQDSPLIDLTIRVQGHEFQTHRLLMASFSRYFQDLSDKGRLKPYGIVILDSLSPYGFAHVLEWIKSSRLDLSPDNVEEVLQVSRYLGVEPLVDKCEQFLAFMETNHELVHENDAQVTTLDLPAIFQNRKYLQYTADELCLLLEKDDIQIDSETDIYNVACDWLLHQWHIRQKYVGQVMQCVRFKTMSPFELRDILLQSPNPIALNIHLVIMLLHALLHLALQTVNYDEPRLGPVPVQRTSLLKKNGDDSSSHHDSISTNTELLGRSSLSTDYKERLNLICDKPNTEPNRTYESDLSCSKPATPHRSPRRPAPKVCRAVGRHRKRRVRILRKREMTRGEAASRIQSYYRGHRIRKRIDYMNKAATKIQKTFRGHLVRQNLRNQKEAAAVIQRGYRRYTDHKKYDYLTAAAAYSPSRRTAKHERLRGPKKYPDKPYFHLPSDPAFICFGGITNDPGADLGQVASSVYAFDIQSDEWQLCGTMPKPRADAAACLLGRSLVLTGGYDPTESPMTSTSTVWMLDITTGEWEPMPNMLYARRLHGQVISDGRIYVVGGCGDGCRPLDSTEVYEPYLNRWVEVASLEIPRFAAAVASHDGKIWICGGIFSVNDDETRKITHEVEVYDPKMNKWSKEKPLPAPRAFCDLASFDDTMLIIAGGVEGSFQDEEVFVTSTILTFDFDNEKWRYLMNLPGHRYKAKIVSRDPYWCVVGGESAISGPSLSTVECFDMHDQRWVAIPHLPVSLKGTCCISIP